MLSKSRALTRHNERRSLPRLQLKQAGASAAESQGADSCADLPSDFDMLNADQRAAATGPTNRASCIVACAGSGKTLTVTARVAFLLRRDVAPNNILAITFTRKAADDMRNRVERVLGRRQTAGVTLCNFHQFCLRLLRQNYTALGFQQHFTVLGAEEQKAAVLECVLALQRHKAAQDRTEDSQQQCRPGTAINDAPRKGWRQSAMQMQEGDDLIEAVMPAKNRPRASKAKKDMDSTLLKTVAFFTNLIRNAKNRKTAPRDYIGDAAFVFRAYVQLLKDRSAIDFSDMIPLCIHLLERRNDILQHCQDKWRYLLVDEFQDVSKDQFALLRMLVGKKQRITVCGDDDQAIYSWRGGKVESFGIFQQAFPAASFVVLRQTYRSSANIVQLTRKLISHNTQRQKKDLWTENAPGEAVRLLVCSDPTRQAKSVARFCVNARQHHGYSWSQIAVLSRTRKPLALIKDSLTKVSVPTSVTDAKPFRSVFKTAQALDLLAYCTLTLAFKELTGCSAQGDEQGDRPPTATALSNQAFVRVHNRPKRGIGPSCLAAVRSHATSAQLSLLCSSMFLAGHAPPDHAHVLPTRQKCALTSLLQLLQLMLETLESSGLHAMLQLLVRQTRYRDELGKGCSKARQIGERRGSLERFLQHVKHKAAQGVRGVVALHNLLVSAGQSEGSPIAQHVTLSTIHQAKGLEWEVVILVGFNENCLPLAPRDSDSEKHTMSPEQHLEEERRLAYVALSRPRKQLIISFTLADSFGNPMVPSRFLSEIPQNMLESLQSTPKPTTPEVTDTSAISAAINNASEQPNIENTDQCTGSNAVLSVTPACVGPGSPIHRKAQGCIAELAPPCPSAATPLNISVTQPSVTADAVGSSPMADASQVPRRLLSPYTPQTGTPINSPPFNKRKKRRVRVISSSEDEEEFASENATKWKQPDKQTPQKQQSLTPSRNRDQRESCRNREDTPTQNSATNNQSSMRVTDPTYEDFVPASRLPLLQEQTPLQSTGRRRNSLLFRRTPCLSHRTSTPHKAAAARSALHVAKSVKKTTTPERNKGTTQTKPLVKARVPLLFG